jgi:hypothetical protein
MYLDTVATVANELIKFSVNEQSPDVLTRLAVPAMPILGAMNSLTFDMQLLSHTDEQRVVMAEVHFASILYGILVCKYMPTVGMNAGLINQVIGIINDESDPERAKLRVICALNEYISNFSEAVPEAM